MKYRIALIITAVLLWGFYSGQKVIGFWADPEATTRGPFKQVFVMVISPNQDANFVLENEMANTLIARGYKVVRCNEIFPPNLQLTESFNKEQLAAAIRETGCDAVMTLALLDAQTVETYHPGSAYYPLNYGYYSTYYGYYNYYYPMVYTPGYYSVDRTFYLETNLYELAADRLLWSVQSEAQNPKSLEAGYKQYVDVLIKYLQRKGLAKK